ncbi:Hsp20/alpha crystallin family protein [Actinomadura barringtoniae]|uniref:Hsp20/alpha crystallin family protein n=1 Tax=Actinomadura barringtoniae TaxID=1427535 RepID=A0A939TA33_9ACTN|nr:Hsp20/alpha crystallin family protein [Actinomadura barringtoniae]MBO2448630.1 Hsp20/alpha crystallin family protein [Actinomadura barringtoniae]
MAQQPVRRTGRQVAAYSPAHQFEDLYDQMGQLLNFAFGAPGQEARQDFPWVPPADISESEDAYTVEIELPGISKDDIDIQLNDRELVVGGEIVEKEREKGKLRRKTRRVGRFEFRAILPGDVNSDMVDARLRDGVLTLNLPKAETAKPRHIEVSA